MDARILRAIIEKFEGGPVGVGSIAAAVAEDAGTIEEVYEPFLVQNRPVGIEHPLAQIDAIRAEDHP